MIKKFVKFMNSDFIKKMVNNRQIDANTYSILVTALEDARQRSGLDKETGKLKDILLFDIENNYVMHTGQSFIGLINYLIVLDMLGCVFKKTGSNAKEKRNSITYVLEQFSILNDKKDRDTIKALRNCLAHNYSLLSMPQWKDEKDVKDGKDNIKTNAKLEANEMHAFSICWTKQPFLIKIPADADRITRSNPLGNGNHFTEICAESLRDVVEDVFQQIKEGVNDDSVESYLSDDEVKSRFTYSHE